MPQTPEIAKPVHVVDHGTNGASNDSEQNEADTTNNFPFLRPNGQVNASSGAISPGIGTIAEARLITDEENEEALAMENEGQLSSDSHPSLVDLVIHDDMLNFDKYVAGNLGSDRYIKKVLVQGDIYPLKDIAPMGSPNNRSRHPSRAARQQSRLSRETLDDPESRASVYSFYMEKDFRYYFQHPYFRLIIAYFVTICNFLIYAEDPIAHSEVECFIPVVGNCFSFIFMRYPTNGWAVVKVLIWLLAILFGLVVGKILIHNVVFNRWLKLKMFRDDQGSWMTMFFSVILFVFLFSYVYNLVLLVGGDSTLEYRITEYMGIKNQLFMKAAACGTWCGDLFTAWMVTDVMMQVNLYPHWAPQMRRWWNHRWNRIFLFWGTILVTSVVVITVISTDVITWDEFNHDFVASNELYRAILASFILVMDLLIVMQDWDFPHFMNAFEIKLPGMNTSLVKFTIPKCLQKDEWVVHITGKWFNYGIIFFVMILDMNMWKNQIFYHPALFGQYIGPGKKLHTVRDAWSLMQPNKSMVYDFEWRNTTINPLTNRTYVEEDLVMNSRYYQFSTSIKSCAFLPSMICFVFFGVLIWYFGRWRPTDDDPSAGRLKKRKKRFTFRLRKDKALTKLKVENDGKTSVVRDEPASGDTTCCNVLPPVKS